MLLCRRVCSSFTTLVDSTENSKFMASVWNPYFFPEGHNETFIWGEGSQRAIFEYLKGGQGIIITTVEQLQDLHGSVVLFCHVGDPFREYAKLCEGFPRAARNFGVNITNVTCFMHDSIPESYQLITTILLNMRNLESLTVFCNFVDSKAVKNAKSILKCHFEGRMGTPPPRLHSFTDFTIFANEQVYAGDSLIPYFLFGYGRQIKKLHLGGSFKAGSNLNADQITQSFKNVEQLKIGDTELKSIVVLLGSKESQNQWPLLRRISIKVKKPENTSIFPLHDFFRSLLNYSGTLEAFHLQVDQSHCTPIMWSLNLTENNFPNVKDVRLPFHFVMDLVQQYTIPMHLNQIRAMWPNVKVLYLVDMKRYSGTELQPNYHKLMTIGKILERLWAALPASLEKITVRYKELMEDGSFHSVNQVYWKV